MPVYDFFRKVFGPRDNDRGPGQPGFRNPIWDDEADDDDDELDDDFRHSLSSPFGFRIFSGDVMDIHKYFEQQMDDMMKTFQSSFFGSDLLQLPESDFKFPEEAPPTKKHGPNKFLKPWVDDTGVDGSLKQDSDVDGRITSGDIGKLFPSEDEASASSTIHLPKSVYGHSVITRIVRSSDGRLEEEKRVLESDGREEVTLTRQIGDQKYKVTTKKDSQTGITDTTEELVNLDEGKLDDFNKRWTNKLPKPSFSGNTDDEKTNPQNRIAIYSPSETDNDERLFSRIFGHWFK